MKLRKSGRTVPRPPEALELPEDRQLMGLMMLDGENKPPAEEEWEEWCDLDGVPRAWTRKGVSVISVEIGEPDKDAPVDIYQALKDEQRKNKALEDRVAELEAMLARLAARMADETG